MLKLKAEKKEQRLFFFFQATIPELYPIYISHNGNLIRWLELWFHVYVFFITDDTNHIRKNS